MINKSYKNSVLKEGPRSDLSDKLLLFFWGWLIDTGYVDLFSEKSTVCPGGSEEVAGCMTSVHWKWMKLWFFSGYMLKSGIVRLYDGSVFSFFKEPINSIGSFLFPLNPSQQFIICNFLMTNVIATLYNSQDVEVT